MSVKLDLLAIGVHPDDVEISCGGTVIKHVALGKKVGVLHLTRGELGTRGSASIRSKEAIASAKIMGVTLLENLKFADGFFQNDKDHQLKLIQQIRNYQPEIVICNTLSDRHPDHGKAASLISHACFYSGLSKIITSDADGKKQAAWRPKAVYHYIQDRSLKPSFVVDTSAYHSKKMKAIKAYASQFHDPKSKEKNTYISTPEFLQSISNRNAEFGRIIGVKYAEGFISERYVGVNSLFDLL